MLMRSIFYLIKIKNFQRIDKKEQYKRIFEVTEDYTYHMDNLKQIKRIKLRKFVLCLKINIFWLLFFL